MSASAPPSAWPGCAAMSEAGTPAAAREAGGRVPQGVDVDAPAQAVGVDEAAELGGGAVGPVGTAVGLADHQVLVLRAIGAERLAGAVPLGVGMVADAQRQPAQRLFGVQPPERRQGGGPSMTVR